MTMPPGGPLPLSRRGLLCAGAAVALSACRAPSATTRGRLSPWPTRVRLAEVEAAFARLDVALQADDWAAFADGLGPGSDLALWQRIFRGLHAVPMTQRRLDLTPNSVVESELVGTGRLRLVVSGRLKHQIAGVDAVASLQSVNLEAVRDKPGAPLVVESVRLLETTQRHPWELADITATESEHVVLQFRQEDAPVATAAAATIEQGVGRAFATVPADHPSRRVSVLWAWGDDVAHNASRVYGGQTVVEAAGVCFRTDAEAGGWSTRILLMPTDDTEELEAVSCHETVHALAYSWGPGLTARHLVEGLAMWVELGFLEGWRRYNVATFKASLPQAVATHLWSNDFYSADAWTHYVLAGLYFCWLETRLGRQGTFDAMAACYRQRSERPLTELVGPPAQSDAAFAAWAQDV